MDDDTRHIAKVRHDILRITAAADLLRGGPNGDSLAGDLRWYFERTDCVECLYALRDIALGTVGDATNSIHLGCTNSTNPIYVAPPISFAYVAASLAA